MKGIKVSSRKAKGRHLQQKIRDVLLEQFKDQLVEDDIRSTGMGQPGQDLLLSPTAQKLFPYAVECKCQEQLGIWAAISQAEKNATKDLKPVVIFKKNHSKTYITLEFDEFLKILKNQK